MTMLASGRTQQRLREVAREYRQRGYAVVLDPQPEQLPAFLASFRVAMLAQNDAEQVIVEVRTQDTLAETPELDAIARVLEDRPSWRFELVVTNPRDRSARVFRDATPLAARDIRARLDEARQLARQEHGEAALLLAWSATEALLRAIAAHEVVPVIAHEPQQVSKSLRTYGLLDADQYATLQQAWHARNMIVHGYQEPQPLAEIVGELLDLADRLLPRGMR